MAGAVLAGAALAAAGNASAAADAEITYSVGKRGDVRGDLGHFRRVVADTLGDPRGWSLGGRIEFREVSDGADMRILLASPGNVESVALRCSADWSCRAGDRVLINDRRWREATDSWTESRRAYRHYVVNHEVGHYLGLEHRDCGEQGRPAAVMQQQSISLQGCSANVWPRLSELREAARNQDVALPSESPSPPPAPTRPPGSPAGPEPAQSPVPTGRLHGGHAAGARLPAGRVPEDGWPGLSHSAGRMLFDFLQRFC